MREVIYTKYSNDRNEAYRIRTEIAQDETGKRYVYKKWLNENSKHHVEQMYDNFQLLSEEFEKSKFKLNRCKPVDGGLEFEYLTGQTLENVLDDFLKKGENEKFVAEIQAFARELRNAATGEFFETEEFCEIFGKWKLSSDQKTMKISDVDIIFSNILLNKEFWNVIDYEWCFRFPIPVDWIIYRSLHYYESGQRHEMIKNRCNIYRIAGITAEEREYFAEMEKKFQYWLLRGNRPLWQLYEEMGKELYFPIGDMEEKRLKSQERRVEIQKEYVTERSKIQYYVSPVPDGNGRINIEIELEPDIRYVRIDPAQCPCYVKIVSIIGVGMGAYEARFGTNGFSLDNRSVYFTTDDPQILVGDIRPQAVKLNVVLELEYPHRDYLYHQAMLIEQLKRKKNGIDQALQEKHRLETDNSRLNKKLEDYTKLLKEKEEVLQKYKDESQRFQSSYETVVNSTSWKITEPVRKVIDKLKRR